jgi:hypothetical protein
LYLEWKSISKEIGSPAKALENSSTLGDIPVPSSKFQFVLMAEMMKRSFQFFFGTKKWAFL